MAQVWPIFQSPQADTIRERAGCLPIVLPRLSRRAMHFDFFLFIRRIAHRPRRNSAASSFYYSLTQYRPHYFVGQPSSVPPNADCLLYVGRLFSRLYRHSKVGQFNAGISWAYFRPMPRERGTARHIFEMGLPFRPAEEDASIIFTHALMRRRRYPINTGPSPPPSEKEGLMAINTSGSLESSSIMKSGFGLECADFAMPSRE